MKNLLRIRPIAASTPVVTLVRSPDPARVHPLRRWPGDKNSQVSVRLRALTSSLGLNSIYSVTTGGCPSFSALESVRY